MTKELIFCPFCDILISERDNNLLKKKWENHIKEHKQEIEVLVKLPNPK